MRNKILVLGGAYLYNLLYFYDTDFPELFKVKAEIRPVVSADKTAAAKYASRVGELVRYCLHATSRRSIFVCRSVRRAGAHSHTL